MNFHTFVINLKKSTKRWNHMEDQFKKAGITNYHRIDAFDVSTRTSVNLSFKGENAGNK